MSLFNNAKNYYLFILLLLASCGFSAVYKENLLVQGFFDTIDIQKPESTDEIAFYGYLFHIVKNHDVKKKFLLKTKLNFSEEDLILSIDSDFLRKRQIVNLEYILVDINTNAELLNDKIIRYSSYNTNPEPYIDILYVKTIQSDLLISLAQDLVSALSCYFIKQQYVMQ
ncbi:hypothetical protein [Rickettsia endosymbiont of Cardiosporidium cionae]|uniref:hypothetical protein n=1 Tax=Rickettsia endosymbiont of Cardiosporidium cionae TaxID=2777155 RepID=UPI001893911D|nr:hypothetical protein [Rickettsia endosymbiont of Cardiosporidium cionae]KAF8818991.1 hypothetical protein IHI24_000228 [Rickettsia endosymbiont of Cardiosporidium cionae]